ncbi:uncharacterized protein L969DRAFT_50871 [Mixia osmundae IAM 14324]|uniref:Major facilitator superfamily (MFS) profile domain-containing protein n=1 Tax=Mixia osmundae (strain CBS 9802 / IAM 14324 / JCM 22182 / KY 12970) TaxID=764103 RepID=G7E7P0_MIXOS|nr:uncharacterized protein L969DRAFT_50871 [Mixia osmundae IAM 14324]KEI38450.1 hypothetical protein L969DRAFT_50871 [Mixia osmundae IAM 14324]GAA98850.1 hypothetical protein E5Q_05538 [Mixia osmundae IAM 14324]
MVRSTNAIVGIVFVSLILDLLAFTIPLPLFPRLIQHYVDQERHGSTLLSSTLAGLRHYRAYLHSLGLSQVSTATEQNVKWDVTLLGGLLGSVFSLGQCVIAPALGRLSDKYGRRAVLLTTMAGNILSSLVWLFSTTFSTYLLSRIIGGLSEGNVQLSIAIISDVTTSQQRARAMALIGLAFSLCFTFGPALGAYLAPRAMSTSLSLNYYAMPAAMATGLLIAETLLLAALLPETRTSTANLSSESTKQAPRRSVTERRARLTALRSTHLGFILFFSGAEYTLTFLAYDLFAYSNAKNGRLLGFIGLLSALLQGGYVRRAAVKKGSAYLAKTGISSSGLAMVLLCLLPALADTSPRASALCLYAAAAALAYTSATVVNSLNTLASLECDESMQKDAQPKDVIPKGEALGRMRSAGQLGRTLGPLLATSTYWLLGPAKCYGAFAVGLLVVRFRSQAVLSASPDHDEKAE